MKTVLKAIALVVALSAISAPAQSYSWDRAMALFHQQQWESAADAFQKIELSFPGQTDAYLYAGKAFSNLNRFSDADAALQKYVVSHPQSYEALYLLAYVRFREDKPEDSLELSTRAAKIATPKADDLKIVALDYVLLKDLSSAERYLRQALAMHPQDPEMRYSMARVLYEENKFDLAVAEFKELLRLDPGNLKAQDNLGLALEGKGEMQAAAAAYRKAIEMESAAQPHSEQPYINLGALLNKLNDANGALPPLLRAAEIAPRSAKAHLELGRAYVSLDRLEDAQRELEESARLQPEEGAAHYLLGRVYRRLGNNDQAAKEFALTEEIIRTRRAQSSGTGGMGTPSR